MGESGRGTEGARAHATRRPHPTHTQVSLSVADPAHAAADLTAPLAAISPALAAAVSATLPSPPVTLRAKLELVTTQACPRFHADSVGCRALITYCGAGGGTLYDPSCAVCRSRAPVGALGALAAALSPPAPIVQSVDPTAIVQAAPWDILLLKGSAHPDAKGVDGAVHASPPADPAAPQLLLTVDDVSPKACGSGCGC